jgi:trehalose 6-phosphate synthase
VIRKDHETLIRPYPISVDFEEINRKVQTDDFEKIESDLIEEFHLGDCQLLLGVDRIDYTKGIPERLCAIDHLFEKHPELKEKIVFMQVGVLSRIHIAKYKSLNDEIDSLVERINWKHSTDDWSPVIFVRGNMPSSKLLMLYRMAKVCIVSALHDGMNLVAKEYVSAHCDEDGILILSQFAGSARELAEAILINPYDSEQFSDSIYQALTMPEEERRKRMIKMRQIVHENNIFRWAGKFLSGLLKIEFKEHDEVMV